MNFTYTRKQNALAFKVYVIKILISFYFIFLFRNVHVVPRFKTVSNKIIANVYCYYHRFLIPKNLIMHIENHAYIF